MEMHLREKGKNKMKKDIHQILGELEGCNSVLKLADPQIISGQIKWSGLLRIVQQTIDFLEEELKKEILK